MAPTQPITPLRQRMLDDMKLRNITLSTRIPAPLTHDPCPVVVTQ